MNIFKSIARALKFQNRYEGAFPSGTRSTILSQPQPARMDITKFSRREISGKVRYWYRNSPFFAGIIERLITYVIGSGIHPIPDSSDPEWNSKALAVWRDWTRFADIRGQLNFVGLQRLIFRSKVIDGEIFTLTTLGETGRPRLQLIETDWVRASSALLNDGLDGIKLNAYGRPESFRVVQDTGFNYYSGDNGVAVPAASIIHHFTPIRPDQYRGISLFAPAVNTIHNMDDILQLEQIAVKDASAHTNIIETATGEISAENQLRSRYSVTPSASGTTAVGGASSALEGNNFYLQSFGPEVKVLRTGDKYTPYVPQRPSQAWAGFMDFLSHTVCLAANMPPSILLQIKVGGADTRRDLAAAARAIECYQTDLAEEFQDIFEYVIEQEMANPKSTLKNAPPDWNKVSWQYPRSITVDAGRDGKNDRDDVAMGLVTFREYFGQYSTDWKAHILQLDAETTFLKKTATASGNTVDEILNRAIAYPEPPETQPEKAVTE